MTLQNIFQFSIRSENAYNHSFSIQRKILHSRQARSQDESTVGAVRQQNIMKIE